MSSSRRLWLSRTRSVRPFVDCCDDLVDFAAKISFFHSFFMVGHPSCNDGLQIDKLEAERARATALRANNSVHVSACA